VQIQSFKVFCDLAETESFTKAAQINGITQSAVSQQITSLERQLKALLIERSKKKFRLTREGELLYEHGKQIILSYEGLIHRLQESRNVISGTIRVATIYSIGLHDLQPYVKRFLKKHPTVKVHIEYHRANQVYDDVLGNVVDLGLVAYPIRDPKLELVSLREEKLVLICHPGHPFAKTKGLRLQQLEGQKFIGFEPDIPTRKAIDRELRERSISVRHVMEFDNIETVKRAVEIDHGIAIVPQATVIQEVKQGTLAMLPFKGKAFTRPLAILHRKGRVLTPAMKKFIDVLGLDLPEMRNT
jgi:DNA-binding transcriptional LysR family regulator